MTMGSAGLNLLRRLLQTVVTLWVIATLVFLLLRAAPGDPAAFVVDPSLPRAVRDELLRSFGLDRSIWAQYVSYIRNLATGDFGTSFFSGRPVMEEIAPNFVNTLVLVVASLLVSYPIGTWLGAFLASRRSSRTDSTALTVALFFRSAPEFWLGMLALSLLSFKLGWFPDSGMHVPGYRADGFRETFLSLDFLHHLALPTLVAGVNFAVLPLLLARNSVLDVLDEDYIELSRAIGFSRRRILYKHALRNALLPVVSQAAVFIGVCLGSLVAIEVVFSWPGLGRAIALAVTRKDYPVTQGSFFLIALMVSLMNIVADLIYRYLDPRITYQASQR